MPGAGRGAALRIALHMTAGHRVVITSGIVTLSWVVMASDGWAFHVTGSSGWTVNAGPAPQGNRPTLA